MTRAFFVCGLYEAIDGQVVTCVIAEYQNRFGRQQPANIQIWGRNCIVYRLSVSTVRRYFLDDQKLPGVQIRGYYLHGD